MPEEKICPLLCIAGNKLTRCQRTKCAWWSKFGNWSGCIVLSLGEDLYTIRQVAEEE